jgi:hypothetical protein
MGQRFKVLRLAGCKGGASLVEVIGDEPNTKNWGSNVGIWITFEIMRPLKPKHEIKQINLKRSSNFMLFLDFGDWMNVHCVLIHRP